MCAYLEKHPEIGAVIVWKTIRAVRNLSEWGYLTEQLRNGKGVKILSVTEGFPTTPAGQLMGGISAAFGRWQSSVISEQASAGMLRKAQMREYPSKSPIGYLNVKKDHPKQRGLGHEIDPIMGPKVHAIFKMAATGKYTIEQLRDRANEIGLKTLRSNTPSRNMIHKMLTNHFYIGKFTWKGVDYQGNHQPLIDMNLWNAVQDALAKRGKHRSKGKKFFALKDLVTCPEGDAMWAQSQKNRHGQNFTYYCCRKPNHEQCGQHFNEQKLFAFCKKFLEPLALNQDMQAFILKSFDVWRLKRHGDRAEKIESDESKLSKIQARQDNALELYLDGNLDKETWQRKQKQWQDETEQIQRSISLQKRSRFITQDHAQSALQFISGLKERYCASSGLEQAQILKAILSNLILHPQKPLPVYKPGFDLLVYPLWYAREDSNPRPMV